MLKKPNRALDSNVPSLPLTEGNYQAAPSPLLLPQPPAPSERAAAAFPTSLTSTLAARVCSQSNASAMAKTKQGKRDVDAYTIKGTNKVVRGKLPPRPCS